MMKLVWDAIRAATVDTLGVVCVVWLILGMPLLGYQAFQTNRETGAVLSLSWLHASEAIPDRMLESGVFDSAVVTPSPVDKRSGHGLTPHAAVVVVAPGSWIR